MIQFTFAMLAIDIKARASDLSLETLKSFNVWLTVQFFIFKCVVELAIPFREEVALKLG